MESNLVWSSSSSLPRSLSANLTVDVLGRSLNLLDAGLRLEGLEYLLETVLGPYGYFGDARKVGHSPRFSHSCLFRFLNFVTVKFNTRG